MEIFIILGFNILFIFTVGYTGLAVGKSASGMLKEKRLVSSAAALAAAVPQPAPGGNTPVNNSPPNTAEDDTSYSRVTGLLGAAILLSFFWALANLIIHQAIADPGKVAALVGGCGPYFLAGSALFAPYAFNKLSTVFQKT